VFAAQDGSDFSSWGPPALSDHGYTGQLTVPYGIFDTRGVLSWVARRVASDPGAALRNAARNAADTFRTRAWPTSYGPWPRQLFDQMAWAFAIAILIPGALGFARVLARAYRDPAAEPCALLAVVGVTSVVLLAALSMGEARYRYPFDAWWIALAAHAFFGSAPIEQIGGARRAFAGASGVLMVLTGSLLTLTFLPQTSLASHVSPDHAVPAARGPILAADVLATPKRAGHPWNRGTVVLPCSSDRCSELKLTFPSPQEGGTLELSADHNDAYRVTYYRSGQPVAFTDLPLHRGGAGLFRHRVAIPRRALGFDALGITPLYGDQYYSIGHVRVR
jgi:hypothetical protein